LLVADDVIAEYAETLASHGRSTRECVDFLSSIFLLSEAVEIRFLHLRHYPDHPRPRSLFFDLWYACAYCSKLHPHKHVGRALKHHLRGPLRYFALPITSPVAEGLSSKIQAIKHAPAASAPSPPSVSASPFTSVAPTCGHASPMAETTETHEEPFLTISGCALFSFRCQYRCRYFFDLLGLY
jgi:hypothetical protein